MFYSDLIFIESLSDPYGSCWVQPLFRDFHPLPKYGISAGPSPATIEWEEDWSCPVGLPTGSGALFWEQMIYSRVFVRGSNCTFASQNRPTHGGLLLSNSQISRPVTTRQFKVEWLLEGCAALPQFTAMLDQSLLVLRTDESFSESRIRDLATRVIPRHCARMGFTRGGEHGVITFIEKRGEREYLVESLSIYGEEREGMFLSTTYSTAIAKDYTAGSVVFAQEIVS